MVNKEYTSDRPDFPGKDNTVFVVTLNKAHFSQEVLEPVQTSIEAQVASVEEFQGCGYWVPYDHEDWKAKAKIRYGKYFVHRQDGKMHWETFNGTGWAYNDSVITHYADITPPL